MTALFRKGDLVEFRARTDSRGDKMVEIGRISRVDRYSEYGAGTWYAIGDANLVVPESCIIQKIGRAK